MRPNGQEDLPITFVMQTEGLTQINDSFVFFDQFVDMGKLMKVIKFINRRDEEGSISFESIFYYKYLLNMPKICEHLLNLKLQKVANLLGKCQLTCTGNKNHSNSQLDVCLTCGETRCLYFQSVECSYQHSYGTKHSLVYRIDSKIIFCFNCQQNLTEALTQRQEMDVSNTKFQKIAEAHNRIHERLIERGSHPEISKKAEKQKKEKVNAQNKEKQKPITVKHEMKGEDIQLYQLKQSQLEVFGLKNLGNTCFFNSTIQCLYATEALHSLYDTIKIDTELQFGKVGEITLLFRKYLKNTEKHFTPKGIFAWVCKTKGVYKHMDQQDAQELLGVLLNGLIDGEKFWMGEEKRKTLNKNQKNTITEKTFGFYLASRLECLDCNKISWSLDFSLQVAVSLSKAFNKKIALPEGEVPKAEINEQGLIYPEFKESGSIIDTFFSPEYLGKDNYFTCQSCKSQKAVRKFYIKDPPAVLVMTLKRFNNNLSKNNADVKVQPILEMEGHCLNPGVHRYEIYAMIIHNGTARGGHYTALSRRGEGWVYFSDSSFKQITWNQVRTSQPYILFYRRIAE